MFASLHHTCDHKLSQHQFKGRREDFRLVTGQGRFTDDHHFDGEVVAHFLRADRAHARIKSIDTEAARKVPGVLAVLTGADLVATAWKAPPVMTFVKGVGGSAPSVPMRTGLAHDRVRYVGEPVALVVAETDFVAQDAAEQIVIDYEDLPVVIDARAALADGAPLLHDNIANNLAFDYEYGDRAGVEQAFTQAAHIVRVELHAQRVSANPMEPKSCVARYDAAKDMFELCVPTQGAGVIKGSLASITGMDFEKFRVHSDDVGGGFGARAEIYPEFLAVMLATKRTGKPVKWTGLRTESISGDHHGRAADLVAELAVDSRGQFLALRSEWTVNLGAYCAGGGIFINTAAAPTAAATGLYNLKAVYGRHRLAFTNTTPTTAYRGAARPHVTYQWERLVEAAAEATGIDTVTLRRKNALRKTAFPYKTLTGAVYDSADPARLLDAALAAADWKGFKARRKAAKKKGKLRGLGLALFLEPSGGRGQEQVEIRVAPDGRLMLYSNAGPSGQSHETVFPEVIGDILGVASDSIELRYNDDAAPRMVGLGTFGSRSLISHGAALSAAAKEIVEKGKKLAADKFEVAPADVTFEKGNYRVAGTDLTVNIQTLIADRSGGASHPLDTATTIDVASSFPSGAHVAEVEIDPDTGEIQVVNYVAADDCGIVYNHHIVEGQVQGGLVQGLGIAFCENVSYDPDSGQLLSGTFMDYAMPRADDSPPLTLIDCGVPSPANALGAKGVGEAGTTGAIPTLANAVLDALKDVNVRRLEMPYTPHRIWQAIREAR